MPGWSRAALGDLAALRKGLSYKGEFLDRPGLPLLGLGAFRAGGGYLAGKERSYGGPYRPQHRVEPGDLLLALTDLTQEGHVLGSPALVPGSVGAGIISHHVAAVHVLDPSRLLREFLYHVLRSEGSRAHFRSVATGTTVRAVSIGDAGRLEIPLPPLAEQRRISAVLGALDARIAVLERLVRSLEEMALAAFQAWVADVAIAACDWPEGRLEAIVELDPPVRIRKGDLVPFVDMKALPTKGPSVGSFVARAYRGGSRFENGDTLLARITPCLENGKSALVDFLEEGQAGAGTTELIVMRPRAGVPRALPYCFARHEAFRRHAIANRTGSSGRQRVSAAALGAYSIRIPPADVLLRFGRLTEPMLAAITCYTRQARSLAATSAALLPRLVVGELRVPC